MQFLKSFYAVPTKEYRMGMDEFLACSSPFKITTWPDLTSCARRLFAVLRDTSILAARSRPVNVLDSVATIPLLTAFRFPVLRFGFFGYHQYPG